MKLAAYKEISTPMYAELETVFAKYGLKLRKLSAGVEEVAGTVKLTMTLGDLNMKAKDGSATTPEAERYKRMACFVDLKPEWLGGTIKVGARYFKLQGMLDTKGAKSLSLLRDDGKSFVVAPAEFKKAAEREIVL